MLIISDDGRNSRKGNTQRIRIEEGDPDPESVEQIENHKFQENNYSANAFSKMDEVERLKARLQKTSSNEDLKGLHLINTNSSIKLTEPGIMTGRKNYQS